MTAFDYSRATATADRLIKRYGQAGKLRRPTKSGTAYNPTSGAPDEYDVNFAVLEYDSNDVDGKRILATDKMVYLAKGSLSVDPATSDLLVEADGGVYKVVDVKPLKPATTAVFYQIQARR